jgi:alpha-tubulin suppressor-like RCC1 family protein
LWGDNTFGQIGDNTSGAAAYKSSPVQTVSGGVDWCSHNLGGRHALAIKLDGKVWSWGWNAYGQLGDNTVVNRSSPVLSVNSNQWQQVAGGFDFSLAIDDYDDLWSWGHNNKYQLGLGDTIDRSSPVISPVSANWIAIAAGYDHGAAIDSNNKLYCWGSNAYGQCGNPIATPQIISPTETSLSGTNWEKVACGKYYTIALKDDGGIWAWGNNVLGQFGNSSVVNSDVPVQVQYTDWVNVTTGGQFSAGIRWRLGPTPTPSYTPSPTPSGSATPTPTFTPSVTPSPTPTPTIGCVIEPLTIMAAYDPAAIGNPCGDDEHKCDYASFTLTVNGIVLGVVNLNNRSDGGPRVVNFSLSSSQVNILANLDPAQDLFFHFTCNTQCGVACGPISPTNYCTYDYDSLNDLWSLTSSAHETDCGCYSPQKLALLYDLFGLSTFTIAPQKFARGTNGWCLSRNTANWLVDEYDGCHDGTVWLSITGDDTGKIYHDGCYSRGVTINICDPKPTTTPSPSPSVTPSPTPSPSISPTVTVSPTPSSTAPTPTPSGTEPTPSPTSSPTPSGTDPTATPTPSPSQSPSNTPSPTPSPSNSPTGTPTPTPTECAIAFSTTNILYSQSSVYYLNQLATNAVMNDGNFAQTLQTGTDGGGLQWIQMDLQCVFRVTSVIVGCDFNNTLAGGWGPSYTAGQDVQYSFDGITWYFMFNTGNFTQGIQSYPTDITCRYIRIINSKGGFLAVTQFTVGVTTSPTTTVSPTVTASPTPTPLPTSSTTVSPTPSGTEPTPTPTISPTVTLSPTPSPTPSPSASPSVTPSPTPSGTGPTPTPTSSPTPSASPLPTPIYSESYLWSCGYAYAGILGNGQPLATSSLVQTIYADNQWSQLATSVTGTTVAIKNDGSLWAWGLNYYGQVGTVGYPSREQIPISPTNLIGIKFVQVAAGFANIIAIAENGDVYGAGDDSYGQQGDGILPNTGQFKNFYNFANNRANIGPAKYVAQGKFCTFIINGSDKLFAAGLNDGGQLSTGDTQNASYFNQINSDNTWLQVSSMYRTTAAIRSDNTLWLWGSNANGILGQNLNSTQLLGTSSPVQVIGGGSWLYVSVAPESVYAIKSDTSIWSWGTNSYGELGDNTVITRSSPVQLSVTPNTGWSQVAGGLLFAAARKTTGAVYSWGRNILGQLGPQSYSFDISQPTQILTGSTTWTSIAVGYRNIQFLTLETPGPTASPTPSPTPLPSPTPVSPFCINNTNSSNITVTQNAPLGYYYVNAAFNSSSTVFMTYVMSNSANVAFSWATSVTLPSSAFSAFLYVDSVLWNSWEANSGAFSIFQYNVPAGAVIQLIVTNITQAIVANSFSGFVSNYDCGVTPAPTSSPAASPSPTPSPSPSPSPTPTASGTPSPTSTPFPTIPSTGANLWLWGENNYGQIGDGTTIYRSSPVQTLVVGRVWGKISMGAFHGAGILVDQTLWTWGRNNFGQLGQQTTLNTSSPAQTVTLSSDWYSVAAGYNSTGGIKYNGTLWMWGFNILGTLGDNTVVNRSSPVLTYAGGNNWVSISIGRNHSGGIKSDGTLWMWGGNANGQLGNNSTVSLSSAVQTFVSGTDWASIYCGDNFTIAIKTDGEIWGWGLNSTGQFGNETYISNSVPTQVIGYSSTWTEASAGSGFAGALGNFNPPPTMSPSPSATVTPTPTPPTTLTPTPSPSPSGTQPTMTPTLSPTPSGTEPTMTPTPSPSMSPSPTPSASLSPTPTGTEATMTPTPSASVTPSATATPAPSSTGATPTPTPQPTQQGYYLYLWGNNAYGQLSQDNLTNTSFPTQILGNTKLWTGVATGTNIAGATKTDGSLWVWGSNFAGQLANETTVSASSLIQVVTGVSQWVQISAGQNTMGGISKPN